jgi:hypothetical protein
MHVNIFDHKSVTGAAGASADRRIKSDEMAAVYQTPLEIS